MFSHNRQGLSLLLCVVLFSIVPPSLLAQSKDGTTPPKGADCSKLKSKTIVYRNLSDQVKYVTLQIANSGTCDVVVGTPADVSKTPLVGIVDPKSTVTYTLTVAKKGATDIQSGATDVVVAFCDARKDSCDYLVSVIGVH